MKIVLNLEAKKRLSPHLYSLGFSVRKRFVNYRTTVDSLIGHFLIGHSLAIPGRLVLTGKVNFRQNQTLYLIMVTHEHVLIHN